MKSGQNRIQTANSAIRNSAHLTLMTAPDRNMPSAINRKMHRGYELCFGIPAFLWPETDRLARLFRPLSVPDEMGLHFGRNDRDRICKSASRLAQNSQNQISASGRVYVPAHSRTCRWCFGRRIPHSNFLKGNRRVCVRRGIRDPRSRPTSILPKASHPTFLAKSVRFMSV